MASGAGLRDWLVQRFTAVVLLVYTVTLFFYLIRTPKITYQGWAECFTSPVIQAASFLALLCLMLHAWVGIWTVATDYIKLTAVRWVFLGTVIALLIGYFAWGLNILWG